VSEVTCPGCGLVLPATGSAVETRGFRATPECVALVGEVTAFGMQHPDVLGRWHQTSVDAYAAQHVGPGTRPISIWFALNGLYLVLEREFNGIQARQAHGHLANTVPASSWRSFEPPMDPGAVTVLDVALSGTAEEQAIAVLDWGASVWKTWAHVHDEVRATTERQLAGWRPTAR
jgi:hypothetical protein